MSSDERKDDELRLLECEHLLGAEYFLPVRVGSEAVLFVSVLEVIFFRLELDLVREKMLSALSALATMADLD